MQSSQQSEKADRRLEGDNGHSVLCVEQGERDLTVQQAFSNARFGDVDTATLFAAQDICLCLV